MEFSQAKAGNKILLEIKPPKGAFISGTNRRLTVSDYEGEFLIPSGQKYIVRGIKEVRFSSGSYGIPKLRFVIQLEMQ